MPVVRHDARKEQLERDRRRREAAARRKPRVGTKYSERRQEEVEGRNRGVRDAPRNLQVEKKSEGKEERRDVNKGSSVEILVFPKIRPNPEAQRKEQLAKKESRRKSKGSEDQTKVKKSLGTEDKNRKSPVLEDRVKLKKSLCEEEIRRPGRRTVSWEKEDVSSQLGRGTLEKKGSESPIPRVTLRSTGESVKEEGPKNNRCWQLCRSCQEKADLLKRFCVDLKERRLCRKLAELLEGRCTCPRDKCRLCHNLGELLKRGKCCLCRKSGELLKRSPCAQGRCSLCRRSARLLKRGCACIVNKCPTFCHCLSKLLNRIWTGLKRGRPYLGSCLEKLLNRIWTGLKSGFAFIGPCLAEVLNYIWTGLKRGGSSLGRRLAKLLDYIWAGLKSGCPYLCHGLFQLLKGICSAIKDVACHTCFAEATT